MQMLYVGSKVNELIKLGFKNHEREVLKDIANAKKNILIEF